MIYKLVKVKDKYIIYDDYYKYLLAPSKYIGKKGKNYAPFYLYQIKPYKKHITGLYYDLDRKVYKGRTSDLSDVYIRLGIGMAEIEFRNRKGYK